MNFEMTELFGYLAAFLTTSAFLPQAVKSWRTRDLTGISLPMYALFTLGVALWLFYGMAIKSYPVVIANAITLLLSMIILVLKAIDVFGSGNK